MTPSSATDATPVGEDPNESRVHLQDGVPVEVGPLLAKAGEGRIHAVANRANLVAKIFHTDLAHLDEKLDKVAEMIGSPPTGAVQRDGFVVLAWPSELLYRDGVRVGYLMPRIDTSNAVEIHALSNPSNRSDPLPGAPNWTTGVTWRHLVTTAANLCLAVEVVHRTDAVIGDFQERNILVASTTRVTLVDCDSMQFAATSGRQFPSPLGRPEFTAPELAHADLRTTRRDKSSDLFALAVHVHLLLMAGNHPFLRGTWTGRGEQPNALTLAQRGHWAGGPDSQLATHPLAPPVAFLPDAIRRLFGRAFTDGVRNPAVRPSAAEWRRALTALEVTTCARNAEHQMPVGASCPWCRIEEERRTRRSRAASPNHDLPEQTILPALARPRNNPKSSALAPPVGRRPSAPLATPTTQPPKSARPQPVPPTQASPPQRVTTPMPASVSGPRPAGATRSQQPEKSPWPKRQPAPKKAARPIGDPSEEFGLALFMMFKVVAIPTAILIVILTVWVVIHTIDTVTSRETSHSMGLLTGTSSRVESTSQAVHPSPWVQPDIAMVQ